MSINIKENIGWSKTAKKITIIGSVIIFLSIGFTLSSLYDKGFNWIDAFFLFLLVFVYLLSIIYAPTSIHIDDKYLTVKRLVGSKKINRDDIIDIYPFYNEDYNIRLFASSGLFGFTGIFLSKQEGIYMSYVGDYELAFLVILKNKKKYLISSDNQDLVIATLSKISEEKC